MLIRLTLPVRLARRARRAVRFAVRLARGIAAASCGEHTTQVISYRGQRRPGCYLGERLTDDVADREPPGEHARPDLAGRRDGEYAVSAAPAQLTNAAATVADTAPDLTHIVIADAGNPDRLEQRPGLVDALRLPDADDPDSEPDGPVKCLSDIGQGSFAGRPSGDRSVFSGIIGIPARLDDTLYLSAFGKWSEGHRSGMYKLTAAANGVLHAGFLRHFDDVWDRSHVEVSP